MAARIYCNMVAQSNVPIPSILTIQADQVDIKKYGLGSRMSIQALTKAVDSGLKLAGISVTIDFSSLKGNLYGVKYKKYSAVNSLSQVNTYLKNSAYFAKDTYNKLFERIGQNSKTLKESKNRLDSATSQQKLRLRSEISKAERDMNDIPKWLSEHLGRWDIPGSAQRG